jgi:hypothetical protein
MDTVRPCLRRSFFLVSGARIWLVRSDSTGGQRHFTYIILFFWRSVYSGTHSARASGGCSTWIMPQDTTRRLLHHWIMFLLPQRKGFETAHAAVCIYVKSQMRIRPSSVSRAPEKHLGWKHFHPKRGISSRSLTALEADPLLSR